MNCLENLLLQMLTKQGIQGWPIPEEEGENE